jgi:hypothetical protein
MKRILALLLSLSFVMAASPISENTGDVPVTFWDFICATGVILPQIMVLCTTYNLVTSTSNVLTAEEADSMVTGANTIHDMEINLLKEEIVLSEQRIGQGWNNLLTILFLILEIIKIIYYSILILLVLFIPFLYLKLINFIRGLLFKWNKKTS